VEVESVGSAMNEVRALLPVPAFITGDGEFAGSQKTEISIMCIFIRQTSNPRK